MSILFVFGPAGSGKTEYLIKTLVEEAAKNRDENYFYIVPEQFTMEAQRDIVSMHSLKGTMNIDAIGFNRLAYRVFDELLINPGQVLEDFGKSMLIKKLMIDLKDELLVYGSYINKMGFVDEMKSMMSELFQYAVNKDTARDAMDSLDKDSLTYKKLHDVSLIYDRFEQFSQEESCIVAEQLTELLADNVERSGLLAGSHLYLDGFTGFTPVQLKLIEKLMEHSASMTFAFDAESGCIGLSKPKEYELFRLTKETVSSLIKLAAAHGLEVKEDASLCGRGRIPYRFKNNRELAALEKNIFRYPHGRYEEDCENIRLIMADNVPGEAEYVARTIRDMVADEKCGYRYKDFAVIAGDLEDVAPYYKNVMEQYNIPVFIDANVELKGDPCSDTLRAFLGVMSDNFSFDSLFRLLKSQMTGIDIDDIESIENYALKHNIRGYKSWQREITDKRNASYGAEMESIRQQIISLFSEDCIQVFKPYSPASKNTALSYTKELYRFLDSISVFERLEEKKSELYSLSRWDEGDAYGRICDKLVALFDKIVNILGDYKMTVKEYAAIMEAGLSSMEIGIVPPTYDRVVVGDITRSRLSHVKVVFLTGVNEGNIPKPAKTGRILSSYDREKLSKLGVNLAPSDRTNAYIEQFYIYQILTKPSDMVHIVYRNQGSDGKAAKPSYLVDRIKSIFPKLKCAHFEPGRLIPVTKNGVLSYLTTLINDENRTDACDIRELMSEKGYAMEIEAIDRGRGYSNIPKKLSEDTVKNLYGTELSLSVSKLEQYAKCQFRYFLTYGLGLLEREICELNPANVGTILHETCKRLCTYVRDKKDNDWESLDDDTLCRVTSEILDKSADEVAGDYFEDSNRSDYMKKLLRDVSIRTAKTIKTYIRCGKLVPTGFEKKFNTGSEFDNIEDYCFKLENGLTMSLTGVIDRVDEYIDGNDLYFKIVDYKSSEYTIDKNKILTGLTMQLITYGAVAYELEKRKSLSCDDSDMNIHMGGLFYYTFDNPYIDISKLGDIADYNRELTGFETGVHTKFGSFDVDAFEKLMLEASRHTGICSSNGAVMDIVDKDSVTIKNNQSYDDVLIKQLIDANRRNIEGYAKDISRGHIDINPVNDQGVNACTYCKYRPICCFDTKYADNMYRKLDTKEKDNYDKLSQDITAIKKSHDELKKKLKKIDETIEKLKAKYDEAKETVEQKGDNAKASQLQKLASAKQKLDDALENKKQLQKEEKELIEKKKALGLSQTL